MNRCYPQQVVPVDPYIGTEIQGQFRIVGRIGTGGMGAVYKAEQPAMNRVVAIKILHSRYLSRADLLSRFRREARAMSHLSHPNIARVFLYGELDDGSAYIVMEYLEGSNLARRVLRQGPMEPEKAVGIMVQVCGALEEAHRSGMVHRDLKPENIFLCNTESGEVVPKLLDFGLAKVTERELQPGSVFLTRDGAVFGTPEFMSPEQAQGKVLDPRSDIYSLAVILYEMLTGELPFNAAQATEYMSRHINDPPIPLSERAPSKIFPPGLEEVIHKALEKSPRDRYQSAEQFSRALQACIAGSQQRRAIVGSASEQPKVSGTASSSSSQKQALWKKLGLAAFLVAVLGVVVYFLLR